MSRVLASFALVAVSIGILGCNPASLNREKGKQAKRSKYQSYVDQVNADAKQQMDEVRAYANSQLMIGNKAVKTATPQSGKPRSSAAHHRSKPAASGSISTNPYLRD